MGVCDRCGKKLGDSMYVADGISGWVKRAGDTIDLCKTCSVALTLLLQLWWRGK